MFLFLVVQKFAQNDDVDNGGAGNIRYSLQEIIYKILVCLESIIISHF